MKKTTCQQCAKLHDTTEFRGGGQGRNRTADASLFRTEVAQIYLIETAKVSLNFDRRKGHYFGMVLE
jgi:hypothetical protein